jgi:GalNAc-alpha-(1->4)-GalNAc-alpha-(1->3)-diNAcBac-PP-undecaprenol alpha-1,4-N-acetyl-D-galactosaminyltransferase
MKIAFVIASLDCGGAERVAATLADEWAARGETVSIITFDEKGKAPFYSLNDSVRHIPLECGHSGSNALAKLLYNARKILKLRGVLVELNPDIVITFMTQTNISALIASAGTGIPVIITEHINSGMLSGGAVWDALMRIMYPFAASLVAVSKGVLDSLPGYIRKKGRVIYNPVKIERFNSAPGQDRSGNRIMGMGRLTGQKGFDLFIRAFSLVSDKNPSWNVEIFGEGEQRGELELLRDKFGLRERFRFSGITETPFLKFAKADIFVLSSRFEGFPVVLYEAMSQGLPVISFACPSGPKEIIRDQIDGMLVPPENVEALAKAMDYLMNNCTARERMGMLAREAGERFSITNIIKEWDSLIQEIT